MNARERGRRTARTLTGVLAVATVIGSGVGAVVLWRGTEEAKASASELSTGTTESGTTGSQSSTSPTPTSTPHSTGSGSSTGGLVAPSQGGSSHATTKGS